MNEGRADGHHYGIEYWEIWNEPVGKSCSKLMPTDRHGIANYMSVCMAISTVGAVVLLLVDGTVISAIVAVTMFKEKLTVKSTLDIAVGIAGLIMIKLL